MDKHYKVASWLPPGESGDWKVTRFTVSPEDEKLGRIRAMYSFSSSGRFVPAGQYTKLTHRGATVMSDTPDEYRDHIEFIRRARGRVLIHGLGLGMAASIILRDDRTEGCKHQTTLPRVDHVTIVELAPEVIKLVGRPLIRRFGAKRVDIIQGDARTWKPPVGARWDVVWHDIWNDLCEDNLDGMATLHRRFGRRCDWQGSWSREDLLYQRARDRRAGW